MNTPAATVNQVLRQRSRRRQHERSRFHGRLGLAAAGLETVPGDFSWSLLDIAPPLVINPQTGFLTDFEANGVGQFSAIPEPATLSVLLAGGLVSLLRRRRA